MATLVVSRASCVFLLPKSINVFSEVMARSMKEMGFPLLSEALVHDSVEFSSVQSLIRVRLFATP